MIICIVLTMGACGLPLSAHNAEIEDLLCRLDSVVEHPEVWEGLKRHRLSELHKKAHQARTPDERYWLNKNLFEEYSVFNADSAMAYADRNYELAGHLGDESKRIEWNINRSFILAVTGLLKEAQDAIEKIDTDKVPDDLLSQYYNQLSYLYSHYGQYMGDHQASPIDYYVQSRAYQDSTFFHSSPSDPLYLWYKAWSLLRKPGPERQETINELKADVDTAKMDSRVDAMKAYALARLYEFEGDQENQTKYLTISAICDVKTANKDIASLEELGKIMLAEDDIDRAYAYINYCQQQAQSFNNRVRALTLAHTEKQIREKYSARNHSQQLRLHIYLVILATATVILIILSLIIIRKNKRLKESQESLSSLNSELKDNIEELSALREAQEAANRRLKEMNTELSEVNSRLKESNFIKEEYMGHVFTMCSNYINKIENLRKLVLRKLKANQIDDLMDMVDSNTMAQSELKEFYQNFDSIFLNMYPDFVKDFNELLRPEERITVRDSTSLTTELRIYALVRLGINDSVKIAALLHYSPQTVYNNRLRTRNKAIIPKEKFAETVQNLGKFHE
ncbi:MAG: transcriptional regulator [Duncaniella sp.]|nr:transcriptional regulator [Duncaniella sp.]